MTKNAALRVALDAIEHRARTSKYDNMPGHHYNFSMTTLVLEHEDLAELALKCFRKKMPDSDLLDHEVFASLQCTQDNRLQKIISEVFIVDDTVSPPMTLEPAGKAVSVKSKDMLTEMCR